MKVQTNFHGSDLEQIEKIYNIPRSSIISFSDNVNPLGISPAFRNALTAQADSVSSYPDRAYSRLRDALSAYCYAPAQNILVGSGATELISILIHTLHPRKALIINPTYSEYEREIRLSGGCLDSFLLKSGDDFALDLDLLFHTLSDAYDLLILCNPNNPTGTALTSRELTGILNHCLKNKIQVMVDETYVEFTEQPDEITAIPLTEQFPNLFVLRGVSKFFCAPGLRLGYGITSDRVLREQIAAEQNPWSVHSIAAAAAPAMFTDTAYISKTKEFISQERLRLISLLGKIPSLYIYHPTANFILMRILKEGIKAQDVFSHAAKAGLILRDCSSFPGLSDTHIRFCFRTPEDNERLIRTILEKL